MLARSRSPCLISTLADIEIQYNFLLKGPSAGEMRKVTFVLLTVFCFTGKCCNLSCHSSLLSSVPIALANIFTVVPVTQYVYINDTVTFECATNLTGYKLFFETKLSVVETFDGMMVALNLKASIEVNGTAFTCRASNGDATEPAYVYVQGQYIHQCIRVTIVRYTIQSKGPKLYITFKDLPITVLYQTILEYYIGYMGIMVASFLPTGLYAKI